MCPKFFFIFNTLSYENLQCHPGNQSQSSTLYTFLIWFYFELILFYLFWESAFYSWTKMFQGELLGPHERDNQRNYSQQRIITWFFNVDYDDFSSRIIRLLCIDFPFWKAMHDGFSLILNICVSFYRVSWSIDFFCLMQVSPQPLMGW